MGILWLPLSEKTTDPIHLPGSSQCCPAAQAAETSSSVPGAVPGDQHSSTALGTGHGALAVLT